LNEFDVYARFYDLDYQDLEDDLFLVEQFAARCGSPILELGCGTGRVLLPLARAGYQVTGVDLSAGMLAEARRKAAAEGLEGRVDLVQQDVRKLELDGRFTMAFSVLNSFMHLADLDEQLAALARIRHHLKPDGLFLLSLFNPDLGRLLDFRGQVTLDKVMEDPDTGHKLMRSRSEKVDLGQQTLYVTYIMDEIGEDGLVQRTLFPFSLRYLFRYELELLLRHAGFELENLYGSYDLDPFAANSDHLIAVARPAGLESASAI
jgi:SAM-dependent methyltransferase